MSVQIEQKQKDKREAIAAVPGINQLAAAVTYHLQKRSALYHATQQQLLLPQPYRNPRVYLAALRR
jgi:hypothetical protein